MNLSNQIIVDQTILSHSLIQKEQTIMDIGTPSIYFS